MNAELLVLCGRPLPVPPKPFHLELAGVEVSELIHGTSVVPLRFEPAVVLSVISKSGFKAHSVAAALACALDGLVFDEVQRRVTFDGRGRGPASNLIEVIRRAGVEADQCWRAIEVAHRQAVAERVAMLRAVEPLAHGP